ncbi:sensor histidine kinase [Sphingomonas sp.]|uniref:sensor histidine kinase n=1 Tax=Sphingomonas sp. TaxID=28214 RepID=UPI002FD9ACAB
MIRAPRSLLLRILAWHAVAVLVTALAVSAGVYWLLETTAERLERQTLRSEAMAIRDDLVVREGKLALASAGARTRLEAAGLGFRVADARGVALIDAMPAVLRPDLRVPQRATEVYLTRRSRRAYYAALSVPVAVQQRSLWILVVQNLDHPANVLDDLVRQFLTHGLIVIAPLLALLLAIDTWIIRRALRPVRRASALARTIAPAQPEIRLPTAELPTEVRPLAQGVNDALDRLTESLQAQRDFTADAAHELRTPITLARVRAEEIADPQLAERIKQDLDSLGNIVAQLLEIAELDSLAAMPMQAVDLTGLAQQAVADIAPLAFRRGQTIAYGGVVQAVQVQAHPQFLSRALRALVENAVQHTPRGTEIIVAVTESGLLVVEDDGPGIALEEQALVFQRFWRRDRRTQRGGGLGLAIVERIALIHGSRIVLSSEPGRTAFALQLSLADPG